MSDIIEYRIFGDDLQLVEIELDPGETVRAEVGTMTYEGLFLATLTGPGKVYLQSLPLSRLADRIIAASRYRRSGEEAQGVAGMGSKLLGDIISGR